MCNQHVCGLMSKLILGFFREDIQSFDIICISETKTKQFLLMKYMDTNV